jgi:ribosomal protein S18 acetylase RimI-like enzyme
MADETADSLREMAQHRGLKLVRSRRRKPGTGDFGKFGLTDEKGKPLLGIGEDGLTASAGDIEDYLRAGAASTWQQSAKMTPDRPAARGQSKRNDAAADEAALPRLARRKADAGTAAKRSDASPPRSSRASEPASDTRPSAAPRGQVPASRGRAGRDKAASAMRERPAPAKAGPKPTPVEVEPTLVLRSAKPADAAALATLLGQLGGITVGKNDVARDLAASRKAGGGVHVAELGPLVGCIAWSLVPTLQRGPIGRITVLIVDKDHRRRGIGAQLLAVAEAALAKKGCALVEAMSDIALKNSHNFFRTLKFDQTSYRFARKIAP